MRRQFAEKANAVGPWIERQMDAVASIAMGMQVWTFFHSFPRHSIFITDTAFFSAPGLFGGSTDPFEGIRAERVRLQIAHGRAGETEPRHPGIDGV